MATNLTPEEFRLVIKLYKDGISIMDICAATGRSRSTVKRVIKLYREFERLEGELNGTEKESTA